MGRACSPGQWAPWEPLPTLPPNLETLAQQLRTQGVPAEVLQPRRGVTRRTSWDGGHRAAAKHEEEWGTKGVRRGHGPFLPPALQALGVSSTSCQGPRRQSVLSRVAQTSALQSKPVDGFCSEPPMFAVQKHSFHKGKHPITGLYLFCFLIDSRSKEMFWKDFPFSSQQDEGDTTPATAVPQLLHWAAPSSWLSTGNHEWSPGALGGSDSRSVLPTGVRPSPPSPGH